MTLSNKQLREYMKRLLVARMRILCNHGFYGLLLMHMKYAIDETAPTAYTDGESIVFGAEFLDSITDNELDFVLMHEVLHVVLQHCFRSQKKDSYLFNIATDIVVNSNILLENGNNPSSITLKDCGECMHIAPNGKEGYLYTAEEVYEMLLQSSANAQRSPSFECKGNRQNGNTKGAAYSATWDDHTRWGKVKGNKILREVWVKHLADCCKAIEQRDAANGVSTLPLFAKRMLQSLLETKTDWRLILNEFVQEEICDYSFFPPDRRFEGSPFYLPDFNEPGKSDIVNRILFFVDTSGSVSDQLMTLAFSEVKEAIEQFNGSLSGWLGFFDTAIIEPKPFSSVDELLAIKPAGGGGTDFQIIFDYVAQHMDEQLPSCIIILTDGFAPFPPEDAANSIPVLWLINNDIITPPWGKVARMEVKE